MLEIFLVGTGCAVAMGFFVFCHRGFSRTQAAERAIEKRASVFSFDRERHIMSGGRKTLSAFLALGLVPVAATRAQTAGKAPMDANANPIGSVIAPQAAPAETAPAAPLSMPAMVGPLGAASPRTFDAGPFGKLSVNGILSGFGSWQNHPDSSDKAARADVSNGQIFIQKTSGLVQYFLQAGAYNLPALGTPLLSTRNTISDYFGPLPQAYLKLAPKGNFSFLIGKLPTLIGAEDTFTFENMNIQRGLLWNQENAVNRGIQLNYSKGKLSGALSWNDGFYSNRYNWLTGELTYTANATNGLELAAGGNLGRTTYSSIVNPLYQNNSDIYALIYTHTAKRWIIEPYFQYTYVPMDVKIGINRTTATQGEAVLGSYRFAHDLAVAGRAEYISSTGSIHDGAINLLYGPGSRAWSLTLTPTYQRAAFFARGEFSIAQAINFTAGDAFGANNSHPNQIRGVIESGFMF
jgi:Putative beta-barrel porin-2, OmpL-like. bbp2